MRRRNPRLGLSAAIAFATLLLWQVPALGQVIADPFPTPIPKGGIVVELDEVASGLVAPTGATHAGDGSGRLFIHDQPGEIIVVDAGGQSAAPFLDLSSEIGAIPPFSERGLIGLAFHPDFGNGGTSGVGRFYTHHSAPSAGLADFTVPLNPGEAFDHQSVITEWTMTDPGAATFSGSRRELMRVDQPQGNHNGGQLAFAPDRTLLIGFGDGGAANDVGVGHGASGNGQNLTTALGNVLRIDPLGSNSGNGAYGIPIDNPFAADPNVLSEILYSGLRNPYRFSVDVDPATSDTTIWLPDVGQGAIEEINRLSFLGDAGANLGWNAKEGSFKFVPGVGIVADTTGLPPGLTDPFAEYDHSEGSAIIGGFVYRGAALPQLAGKYVFADFAGPGFIGRLFALDLVSATIEELQIGLGDRGVDEVVKGMGVDEDGELYLTGGGGFLATGTLGKVWKIVSVPEPGMLPLVGLALALLARKHR